MTDVMIDETVDADGDSQGMVGLDELDQQLSGSWWIGPAARGCG